MCIRDRWVPWHVEQRPGYSERDNSILHHPSFSKLKNDQTRLQEWGWSMAQLKRMRPKCPMFQLRYTLRNGWFLATWGVETSTVRFAEKTGKTSNAGIKMTYHLVFGTNLAIESVFGNAVLDENDCFFFLFSIWTHQKRFRQPYPKIWCSSVTIKELSRALGDAPSFTHFS